MITAADEIEVIDLPAEFQGLPHGERLTAFAVAEARLAGDLPAVISQLGQAVAEQLLSQAAAHYLATTRMSLAQPDTPPALRRGYQVGEPGNRGKWAGSPYGDWVSGILDGLKGGSRRCGKIATPPE